MNYLKKEPGDSFRTNGSSNTNPSFAGSLPYSIGVGNFNVISVSKNYQNFNSRTIRIKCARLVGACQETGGFGHWSLRF